MLSVSIPVAINIFDKKGDKWIFTYSNRSVSLFTESVQPQVTKESGLINSFLFNVYFSVYESGSFNCYFVFVNESNLKTYVVQRDINVNPVSVNDYYYDIYSVSGLVSRWRVWDPLEPTFSIIRDYFGGHHLYYFESRINDPWFFSSSIRAERYDKYYKFIRMPGELTPTTSATWFQDRRNVRVCFRTSSAIFLSKEYTVFVVANETATSVTVSSNPPYSMSKAGHSYAKTSTSYYANLPRNVICVLSLNSFRLKSYSSVANKMVTNSLYILFNIYPLSSTSIFLGEYSGDEEIDYYRRLDSQFRIHPKFLNAPDGIYRTFYVPGIQIIYHTTSTENSGIQLNTVYLPWKPNLDFFESEIELSDVARKDLPSVFGYRIIQNSGSLTYSVTVNNEPPIWYSLSVNIPAIDLSDSIFNLARNDAGVVVGPFHNMIYDRQIPDLGNTHYGFVIGATDTLFYESFFFTRALSNAEYDYIKNFLLTKYRQGGT